MTKTKLTTGNATASLRARRVSSSRAFNLALATAKLEFPDSRTYVVPDQSHDAGRQFLRWDEVAPPRWRGEALRALQLARLLTRDEVRDIRETLGAS